MKPFSRRQQSFLPPSRTSHGGRESLGRRKAPRPFTPKASMHLVLKASRAKGHWSLLHRKNESRVASMVYVYGARFRVKIYQFANVGNHLHLHVKASERKDLADFLRVLAGRIAVTVSGARKQVKRIGRFWDHLYWSRLVKSGHDFRMVNRYIFANRIEGLPGLEKAGLDRRKLRAETLKEGAEWARFELPPWMDPDFST